MSMNKVRNYLSQHLSGCLDFSFNILDRIELYTILGGSCHVNTQTPLGCFRNSIRCLLAPFIVIDMLPDSGISFGLKHDTYVFWLSYCCFIVWPIYSMRFMCHHLRGFDKWEQWFAWIDDMRQNTGKSVSSSKLSFHITTF
jgi:hypothetical protein